MTVDPNAALVERLQPILRRAAELAERWTTPEAVRDALHADFDPEGDDVKAIGAAVRRGIDEGWLCNRGDDTARFSRVAKPSPDTHGLSIDVVWLRGPGLAHAHPNGEITLGFAGPDADPDVAFDGHPPGWVVYPPGSRHTPTVTKGSMVLLYVLPQGAVTWGDA